MLTDALVSFVLPGSNVSLAGAAGVALPLGQVYDILGQGVGQAPQNIIGNAALFGSDMGIGAIKPQVEVVIGTLPVTANAATLNIAFQGAPDTGLAGGYQPGAWQTLVETGPMTVAQLPSGQIVARFDFPPAFPANLNPRYLRLLAQVPAAENFTAGTISSAVVTMVRDDLSNKFTPNNYQVR